MSKKYGGSRLNKRLAIEIRQYAKDNPNESQREIGLKYGTSREAINKILNNVTYKSE